MAQAHSRNAILTAEIAENPFGFRASALGQLVELTTLPKPLSGWGGLAAPSLGPFGLDVRLVGLRLTIRQKVPDPSLTGKLCVNV